MNNDPLREQRIRTLVGCLTDVSDCPGVVPIARIDEAIVAVRALWLKAESRSDMDESTTRSNSASMAQLHVQKLMVQELSAMMKLESAPIRAVIREMVQIINDPETDHDDRQMAISTLSEALFPRSHDGELPADLEDQEPPA